jgi:phosphatidylinositol dimannoside acyltransferase
VTDLTDAQEALQERIAYRGFATVASLGRVLPTTTGRVLFRWLGIAAFHLLPTRRAVVAANQAHVLGRPVDDPLVRAATREAFVRYARYWFDAFDVATWTDERVASACSFEGLDHIREALSDGTGVVAAVPHMGNWDAIGRALSLEGLPVISVAERLRPDRLFRLFLDHRRGLGMEIVGLDEDVGRQLADMLEANRFVALVADRDLSGKGVEVEMFGSPRRLPAGPALLALRTGAPLVTAALYQTPTGWRAVVHEPIVFEPTGDRRADVAALTERIARAFERDIAVAPADWHLFQPGWAP